MAESKKLAKEILDIYKFFIFEEENDPSYYLSCYPEKANNSILTLRSMLIYNEERKLVDNYIQRGLIFDYNIKPFDSRRYLRYLDDISKLNFKSLPIITLPFFATADILYKFDVVYAMKEKPNVDEISSTVIYNHLKNSVRNLISRKKSVITINLMAKFALVYVQICGYKWFKQNFKVEDFIII